MKLTAEKIAELFGVEVDEEFLLNGRRTMIDDEGRIMMHTGQDRGIEWGSCAWHKIAGAEIEKLPWKPKLGQYYFSPLPSHQKVNHRRFTDYAGDQWRASYGLCFKTREEAEAKWRELYGVVE